MICTSRRATALCCLAIVASGCDFTSFETFRAHAPVVTFLAPDGYPSARYGGLVAIASDGAQRDWLVVSDGLGTPVGIQTLRASDVIAPLRPEPQVMCGASTDCGGGMRFGIGLAGIDGWGDSSACAMTGSYGTIHSVVMRCIGGASPRMSTILPVGGLEMAGFGLAIAAPRRHRTGDAAQRDLLFVGAPAAAGRIVMATPTASTDITPMVRNVSALGSALAVGRYRGADGVSELLLAAGSTSGQVVVMHGDPRIGRAMQPLGCFAHTEPGFGLALTTADLDGDGIDEIVAGNGSENAGRADTVHVYSAADAPGGTTCDASWRERLAVTCTDVPDRHVACGSAALFGAALAGADVDGDGRDEVLVGASAVTVDDISRAGAVFVLHASGAGATLTLTTASVLRDAAPMTDTFLGRDVRAALLGAREEVVAAAPGAFAVRLFLCSGIAGDRPREGGLSEECR